MNSEMIQALLQFCSLEWQKLEKALRPNGVWIAAYEAVPLSADAITTLPYAAWFLDKDCIHPHNVWSYARFIEMQQPLGEIGVIRLAQLEESSSFLVEMQWAGLNGVGYRVTINSVGLVEIQERLWVS